MTQRCENCNQVVLPTDTVCWHCGWELTPADMPNHEPVDENVENKTTSAEMPVLSLTAVSVYTLLTLATILILFFATKALAQYPVIQIDPRAPVKPGWTGFIDHRGVFMLDLPPDWIWLEDELGNDMALLMAELSDHPQYEAALAPLALDAVDTEVRLLAQADASAEDALAGFAVVGESARLNRLTNAEIEALLARDENEVQVGATAVSRDLHGNDMVTAVTQFTAAGQVWQCQQHIIRSQAARFIVSVCQPGPGDPDQAAGNILSSFQLFTPPN